MFGTKNVEIKPNVEYIRPGINEVEFVSVTADTDRNTVDFKIKVAGQDDETATDFKLYFNSEKAANFNNIRIKKMGMAATNDNSIDDVEATSLEGYAKALYRFFAGKKARLLFGGRQYMKRDGNIGVWAELGTGNFAESLSVTETKLRFDEDKMIRKIEVEAVDAETTFGSDSDEGLPYVD